MEVPAILNGDVPVSRETLDRLAVFKGLFDQWSQRINLVAPSTMKDVWTRHIADSAQLLLIKPKMRHVIDLGSGGGFPGVVLAVLLDNQEDVEVHLVESNAKKTAFLQAVRAKCATKAIIHTGRIEQVLPSLRRPEFVTARALASLSVLLELSHSQLRQGAVGLFHKGRDYQREIEESRIRWDFDLVVHKSRIDPESVILEVFNVVAKTN